MDTLGAPLAVCDAPCWPIFVALQRIFAGRLVARWSRIL